MTTEHDRHHGDVVLPAPVYELPSTHQLSLRNEPREPVAHTEFLVTTLGFVLGLRLGLEGWSHFYRTATRKGELVDFFCSREDAEAFLQHADDWQSRHPADAARMMLGAMHWYLFSQSYQHRFEILAAQCSVLDICWSLFRATHRAAPSRDVPRAERAHRMCEALSIPAPEWVHGVGPGSLDDLRRQLILDGRFDGEPIGFAAGAPHAPPIHREIVRLNCRFITALFGVRSAYTTTGVDDNRLHDLAL